MTAPDWHSRRTYPGCKCHPNAKGADIWQTLQEEYEQLMAGLHGLHAFHSHAPGDADFADAVGEAGVCQSDLEGLESSKLQDAATAQPHTADRPPDSQLRWWCKNCVQTGQGSLCEVCCSSP